MGREDGRIHEVLNAGTDPIVVIILGNRDPGRVCRQWWMYSETQKAARYFVTMSDTDQQASRESEGILEM